MSSGVASLKVMVVDDEPEVEAMFRQRLRRDLRSGRYDMVFASSGVHALEVMDENPDVAVVLTDLNMPQMDGMALLSAFRERWPGFARRCCRPMGIRSALKMQRAGAPRPSCSSQWTLMLSGNFWRPPTPNTPASITAENPLRQRFWTFNQLAFIYRRCINRS